MTREWLATNGIGGYASSTETGMNTRRYHGLLVAATHPPVGRMVLLSKFEETVTIEGRSYELGVNRYPGVVHPRGDRYLKEFRREPCATFVYDLDGVEFTKSVYMVYGENTTVIRYSCAPPCSIEVRPLLAFRDYHSTAHENSAIDASLQIAPGLVKCSPYAGCPDLYLAHDAAEVHATGAWYRNFEYSVEEERGLDFREDLFNPMALVFHDTATVVASTGPRFVADAPPPHEIPWTADDPFHRALLRAARGDGKTIIAGYRDRATVVASTEPRSVGDAPPPREIPRTADDPFHRALLRAADQFIVERGDGKTIIAGYHWFSDWGRDTMIALPGLTLATGRFDEARGILRAFAASVDRGMLPNRFPDAGETPEYNTVDATLWFFEAIRAYVAATGDLEFVRAELLDVLGEIVAWHEAGTRYGIRVDSDGLLRAGEPGVQLTWMDAKIGDWVVTPRHGKPVEIQALWYNALRTMQDLTGHAHYAALANQARDSFLRQFWNDAEGCLYDVVDGDRRDGSIRPNQILAVSLAHSMLPAEMAARVVETVERHLLTPYGLRSLAPSDPQYRGRYGGDPVSRDSAYHQGTVWPWLMGPFVTAYRKVHGHSPDWTPAFRRFIEEDGGGQIPEVFDGDAPHRPGGCMAQAWSVAELLRCLVEESQPATHRTAAASL